MLFKQVITICLIVICAISGFAAEIYVSPNGNDRNPGTALEPKATLHMALRQARELRRLNDPAIEGGVHVILKSGTYALTEPVFIRPEDSGTETSPTIIRSENNGVAVISGGISIANWKKSGKWWVADMPEFNGRPLEFRQMWVNGRKAVRARDVADFEMMNKIFGVDNQRKVVKVPASSVKDILRSPRAEMVMHQMWEIAVLRIKSIHLNKDTAELSFHEPESRLLFERPWPRPVTWGGRNSAFYLTNALSLLNQPGEWFLDIDQRKVFYYPLKDEKMSDFEVTVPALENLIQIEGTADRPVQNVKIDGLQFAYAAWNRPSTHGHVPLQAGMYLIDGYRINPQQVRVNNHKLDNQGWLGRPVAAVSVSHARDLQFSNCRFQHSGSTGLDLVAGVKNTKVENSVFTDLGGNGMLAGSFSPKALETHLPYQPADFREVCSHLTIHNNLFEDVSNEEWGAVAIGAGYVHDVRITHNDISNVSYSGISVGWGWHRDITVMKNNLISNNHIRQYAKHMYDVAGIYTLGAQPGTLITENYVHSIYKPSYVHDPNHWFYLYTDEGSSFIRVINNYTEGEKFLQNANGPGNVWENNGPMVNDSVRVKAGRR